MKLGEIGIWLRVEDANAVDDADARVREIEELGYGTLWVGGSPAPAQMRPFLEATSTLTIASGIVNVWRHEPADVAAHHATLARDFPGRFLLGIGIGHPERTERYDKPLATMRAWFDALDAARPPVPRGERIAAAIGPKMLELAAARSLGAHPYFTPSEHTRFARERVGPDGIVAPGLAVVVEPDAEQARVKARAYAKTYLGLRNYTANLLKFGFTEADLADGGSDRLIDTIVPHGDAGQLVAAAREHLDAGADHVCLQPVGHGRLPMDDYRALAAALL